MTSSLTCLVFLLNYYLKQVCFIVVSVLAELSDREEGGSSPTAVSPHALNYSAALASAGGPQTGPTSDPTISSTETLLRNIQGLLKVAADNARQQERQINYEKGKTFPSSFQ